METLEKLLTLVPKGSQTDIGTNALGESTILVLKKDRKDFRAEFVLRGTNEDRITVSGYAEDSDTKSYVNAAGFTEESLEELLHSVESALKLTH